jgi:hypothetical protein
MDMVNAAPVSQCDQERLASARVVHNSSVFHGRFIHGGFYRGLQRRGSLALRPRFPLCLRVAEIAVQDVVHADLAVGEVIARIIERLDRPWDAVAENALPAVTIAK